MGIDGGVGIWGADGADGCDADGGDGMDCDGIDGDDGEEGDDGEDGDGKDGDGVEGLGGCCRGWLWLGEDRDGVDGIGGIWLDDGICGICGMGGIGGVIGAWQAATTNAQPSATAVARSTRIGFHGRLARIFIATPRLSDGSRSTRSQSASNPQDHHIAFDADARPRFHGSSELARGDAPKKRPNLQKREARRKGLNQCYASVGASGVAGPSPASTPSLSPAADAASLADGASKYSNSNTMRMSSLGCGPSSVNTGR